MKNIKKHSLSLDICKPYFKFSLQCLNVLQSEINMVKINLTRMFGKISIQRKTQNFDGMKKCMH